MNYYKVEPEVAGAFGEHSLVEWIPGKVIVKKRHYSKSVSRRDSDDDQVA